MFEITKDQLGQLNDVDLRELVARLCEAELRLADVPLRAVRWAGAHTAPDGGLDVECRFEDARFRGDFVPRARTGFQVKKPAMPPSKISGEMSPKGLLRPIFAELAANNGSYVIVSLDDDPTGKSATRRHDAMGEQLAPVYSLGDMHSDFYGRTELTNWLRQHPAVQLWVRDRLGIPLVGWKPLGRWTNTPPSDTDELICEPGLAIVLPGNDANKLDIRRGIEGIRNLVRTSDKALRIVGLSGVGKSRIVQALFEDSVGDDPLDRSLAIYADLGAEPRPSPRELLARLGVDVRQAILVLDNCPVDTHNLLASAAAATPHVRLITIEYDIREDKPELTAVVRIDAEGTGIVEALVSRRYTDIGQVNSRVIAEFSGGNARLALALADALQEEESLSDFSHEQLFDRLFYQRGAHDANFLAAAQALALVYSYSVRSDEAGVNELATLAGLVGQNRLAAYGATQTLLERQLAQKRGHWRAILPPAVSNRLAARALDYIPIDDLRNTFESLPNTRLLKSFGKRLGYLHASETARQLVRDWMAPGGRLHVVETLDDDDIQLFINVAPVDPDAALTAIEARSTQPTFEEFIAETNPHAQTIAHLLCAIAYDAELFERCVELLARFAIAANRAERPLSDAPSRLVSLFALYLSGTQADPDTREGVLRRFLFSTQRDERETGSGMLEAALNSGRWASFAIFEFGARPRTFGYWPPTRQDEEHWFLRFISITQEAATSEDADLSDHARELLANEFRALWHHPALRPALTTAATALHSHRPWPEGWRAIRSIKHLDYRETEDQPMPEGKERLDELDDFLRPARLSDQVRIYVCDVGHRLFSLYDEFDDDDQQTWQISDSRARARAHGLGVSVCDEPEILDELSQELFTGEPGFLIDFGKGLASACNDQISLWHRMVGFLELAEGKVRHCQVIYGVLDGIHERDESLAKTILVDSASNRQLRPYIVNLHSSVPVSSEIPEPFRRALEFSDTPLEQFASLLWQRPPGALAEPLLFELFLEILGRPHGAEVVLNGLGMRHRAWKKDALGFCSDLKRLLACWPQRRCYAAPRPTMAAVAITISHAFWTSVWMKRSSPKKQLQSPMLSSPG